jgi:DNA-binding response OmpR family regulator
MRVLVVEHDPALAVFLQKALTLEGYEVDLVGDGHAAVQMAAKTIPALAILDLGLPLRDSSHILESLRKQLPASFVLVLADHTDVQERVRCLDLGADDFVLKPFSAEELMARCRALLRRTGRGGNHVLSFGGVEMDRMDRAVHVKGRRVQLTLREFALLEFLMLRGGSACSRSDLLREIWNAPPGARTNVVDVHITSLRKKLATACPGAEWTSSIETVRGVGYQMRQVRGDARMESPFPGHHSQATFFGNCQA